MFSLLTDTSVLCSYVHKVIFEAIFSRYSLKFPDINNINMTFLQPSETRATVLLCYTPLLENELSTARRKIRHNF
jgi:hypothetical protein